jgi:hypothetical protein
VRERAATAAPRRALAQPLRLANADIEDLRFSIDCSEALTLLQHANGAEGWLWQTAVYTSVR